MSVIKKLQNSISRLAGSKQEEAKRDKRVYNYAQAESIALIFKERGEEHYGVISKYMSFLKDEHLIKNLMALCYIEDKETPTYIKPRVDFETFTKKDTNWQQLPSGTIVENFINEPYNILIDLSLDDDMPIKHIVKQSNASFKLGKHSKKNEHLYDMMISVDKENLTPKELIEHVNHYLSIINS